MGEVRALPDEAGRDLMDGIDEWAAKVRQWAGANSKIDRVYFIGSRVRKDKQPHSKSDLDIAIRLSNDHGYTTWFFESEDWEQELQSMIEPTVHLIRGGGSLPNEVGEAAIIDHGILVYSKQS